ncbi:MAG: GntR family transcriptional regulator [Geodermatophilaceae bacterium]|nr:GntR family transcriptional regulator [Geodermatophilaceae bacterium]
MPTRQDVIFATLRQRIRMGVVLGVLEQGQRLPNVRALSREFDVNPRVILAVWERLALSGLVERRDRSGVYVSGDAGPAATEGAPRVHWLAGMLADGIGLEVAGPALAEALGRIFLARPLHALVAESNDDQLWSLADELRHDYGMTTTTLDLRTWSPGDRLEAGPRPEIVITTDSNAREARAIAEQLGVDVFEVAMCPDLFAEVERLLATDHVYFVVSDRDMVDKVRRALPGRAARSRLHVLVLNEDDVTIIPEHAPVYLTRLTRTRPLPAFLRHRGMAESRVFSTQSARALMEIVVSRGMSVAPPPRRARIAAPRARRVRA